MKVSFISLFIGGFISLSCMASNEGVPSYYQQNSAPNANKTAYSKYQNNGYTNYVGKSGTKQIVSSNSYSYRVPRPQQKTIEGVMTPNGIATIDDKKTTIYAGYSRRFADFEFKTGVNSILEWDDMHFNEVNVGLKHVFDIRNLELSLFGDYTYGKLSYGGLSMDYDLEPYDYTYPEDGIFTISMGDLSGTTHHMKFGLGAHHIWDLGGWKLTPQIGYEIFKHNLEMSNHIYPNPGVYLPLMTEDGNYIYGDADTSSYIAVSPSDASSIDQDRYYQICMGPEDMLVVPTSGTGTYTTLTTIPYNSSMGDLPWGVAAGNCVVIGGDGVVKVDGTTHIYNTTWSGFYLGLELEKQMTLSDKLRFYAQVGMPKYSSEGIWPNRDDWQQNPSFLDEGTNGAFSYAAEIEYDCSLSDRLQLVVKADTNYFKIGKIPGELYVAESTYFVEDEQNPGNYYTVTEPAYTEHVNESLAKARWQSFGLHLGLKYSF